MRGYVDPDATETDVFQQAIDNKAELDRVGVHQLYLIRRIEMAGTRAHGVTEPNKFEISFS